MVNRIIILISSVLLLCACDSRTIYSHYESVPIMGWHQDSVLEYRFDVSDTTSTYQILVNIRHTENYGYQNMWLFVEGDTIEFYLADERGRWLGNGKNGYIEMPVLYEENYRFDESGEHVVRVQHAMRDSLLRGVSDVGVMVRREVR